MSNETEEALKALVVEQFACNGEHSHWQIIDSNTGAVIVHEIQDKSIADCIRKALESKSVDVEGVKEAMAYLGEFVVSRNEGDPVAQRIMTLTDAINAQGYLSTPDPQGCPIGEGEYRISENGVICKGTMRIGYFDIDTEPSDEYKKSLYDYFLSRLNQKPSPRKDDAIRDLARSLIEIKEFANTVDTESYGDGLYLSIAQKALTKHADIIEEVE